MEKQIPKVIHYCWFGGSPLPPLALKCIESWKKFAPEYEIKEWNESNFDVNVIEYTKEAYSLKKFAFVSDYARFWILYNYGGIYFDTDVELIKCIDPIIANGPFMGCELWTTQSFVDVSPVNAGLGIGVYAKHPLYKEFLDLYQNKHFTLSQPGTPQETVVTIISNHLKNYGLIKNNSIQCCQDILIYPKDYFCPIFPTDNKLKITENTVSIHHYAASWTTKQKKTLLQWIWQKLHLPKTDLRKRFLAKNE